MKPAGAAQILACTVTRLFYVLCFASKAVRLPRADSACLNSSPCSQWGARGALCPEQIFLKCLLTDKWEQKWLATKKAPCPILSSLQGVSWVPEITYAVSIR